MDALSQIPASAGAAHAETSGARGERLRTFVLFQVTFWGLFFALRAIAAVSIYPEYFWPYMAPRLTIVAVYAAATSFIDVIVSRFEAWTPRGRLVLTLGLCALLLLPLHMFETALTQRIAPDWPAVRFVDYMSLFGWVLLAWAGYYFALDYARTLARQSVALGKAEALAHAAQLKMLRYQLNPHFLFNSLNAVSALVLEGRNKQAEDMLMRLSRFLRHTIDTDPSQMARLGDEATLQRLYLEIEVVRFGDRLRVSCRVPETLHDCLVPTLLLQPIIENAIKHGVARKPEGGSIAISAREAGGRLILTVENDGPPFAPPTEHSGVGLRNTQERLTAIYGTDASLAVGPGPGGGARAVFDLPLRRER